jgi:hypothetical protein
MAYITWKSNTGFATNPYDLPIDDPACRGSIVLTHPNSPDSLVCSMFDGADPYNRARTGFTKSDGRSRSGGVRISTQIRQTERWLCDFVFSLAQLDLFYSLLELQRSSNIPVTLLDRWIPGRARDLTVFVEVPDSYIKPIGRGNLQKIQFSILEL